MFLLIAMKMASRAGRLSLSLERECLCLETLKFCFLFYSVALAIYYHIKNRYVEISFASSVVLLPVLFFPCCCCTRRSVPSSVLLTPDAVEFLKVAKGVNPKQPGVCGRGRQRGGARPAAPLPWVLCMLAFHPVSYMMAAEAPARYSCSLRRAHHLEPAKLWCPFQLLKGSVLEVIIQLTEFRSCRE